MTTTKFKCEQPGCSKEYNDKAHLGIHLRAAHGIAGKSHQAQKSRAEREAKKAAAKPKRRYTKRSTALATIPHEEANGQIHRANGQAQTSTRRVHTEAALAIAFGRFKEIRTSISFEYDLAPRTFAAQLRDLIAAEALW